MAQLALYFWIFVSLLRTFSSAFPSDPDPAPDPAPERTFISELPASRKFSSIKQIKNPKWTRRQVSTTEIYAAPFLKHHIPMPDKLSTALQNPQSPRDLDQMSNLDRRVNGQVVDGSNGE